MQNVRPRISFRETIRRIRLDTQRYAHVENKKVRCKICFILSRPGLLAVALYRLAHYFYARGDGWIAYLIYNINCLLTRSDLIYRSQIGPGLYLASSVQALIDGELGSNVSLGVRSGIFGGECAPVVGDRVSVLSGANIFGAIKVGSDSQVNPCCLLTRSLPDGSIAQGYPAKIVKGGNREAACQPQMDNQRNGKPLMLRQTWQYIYADVLHYCEFIKPQIKNPSLFRVLKILTLPNVFAVAMYRISRYFYLKKLFTLSRIVWNLSIFLTGADINPISDIGKGFIMVHAVGNAFAARFGEKCIVYAQVGVGNSGSPVDIGAGPGCPVIGDHVSIATKATILGPVRIGSRVKIAPCALVMEDVPDNAVVAGNPAKIVRMRNRAKDDNL